MSDLAALADEPWVHFTPEHGPRLHPGRPRPPLVAAFIETIAAHADLAGSIGR
ncbi:hypothetical protein HRK28_14360 [Rathayibacter sp. VKM Ac-2835]|uniref:hypothetical protein n=1 Tax=Rathayibacter sp. VKM Ac-2835 TaxID=2739043 RepID=UPI00156495C5|nr:hypothetical protein [Rathayibacter sp. VKM Ac-2835]NRG42096.1 hypothetical protein [Rathayibacter sp. VKM Ac-2835]